MRARDPAWRGDHSMSYAPPVAKTKMGRPRRAAKVADELIALRLTKAERRAWERAAGDRSLSDWIRDTCNKEAQR
jgi:hypothetical protein